MDSKSETNDATVSETEGKTQNAVAADDSSITITMVDVLEQEKEMEDEYAAVLGASDEKCCTFAQGAVKRQALYSCLTCCPEARADLSQCAGICLACSYRCHEHHELVELYTKRNFRCDCPTERMAKAGAGNGSRCVLNGKIDAPYPRNADNLYNQNFQGLYCACHRPYPDPERTSEEVMVQCAVCEDWFHLQHIDTPPAAAKLLDACSEMICSSCMSRHEFLRDYTGLSLKPVVEADSKEAEQAADVVAVNDDNGELGKSRSDLENNKTNAADAIDADKGARTATSGQHEKAEVEKEKSEVVNKAEPKEVGNEEPHEESKVGIDEPQQKRLKLANTDEKEQSVSKDQVKSKCRRPKGEIDYEKGAVFWSNDWRAALCQCVDCLELYKQQQLEFLLDADDSAKTYEERGMRRAAAESSTYEQGIRALASIGRVQQIDVITEYNHMKDKLKEYLHTFAASNKVVTEADINQFFAQMRNEKKAAPVEQPYYCR